ERANGFANRFLFVMSQRPHLLPFGGEEVFDRKIAEDLIAALEFGLKVERVKRTEVFDDLWEVEYERLTQERHGLTGAMLSRAEAHVRRLSLIYALLTRSKYVREAHLCAALEVWRYCEDSVRYIFGDALGDPTADAIEYALRDKGEMTRLEINQL